MNIQIAPIIKVSDIQKSLSFYCSVFGFSKQWEYAASADGPWYACLTWQGSELHLSSFPGDGPSGVAVYFHIDNVDDLYSSFLKAGLESVELEPTNQSWNQRELYIRDSDGNCLRFGVPLR